LVWYMTMIFCGSGCPFYSHLFHKEVELQWELGYLNDADATWKHLDICQCMCFLFILADYYLPFPGSSGCVEHVFHTRTFIHWSLYYCW
jgi:hypothetical protein